MKMTKEEREEARRRCEEATAGPWESVQGVWVHNGYTREPVKTPAHWANLEGPEGYPARYPEENIRLNRHQDAEFIAHARTDLPRALDTIEALEKELKAMYRRAADAEALLATIASQAETAPSDRVFDEGEMEFDEWAYNVTRAFVRKFTGEKE